MENHEEDPVYTRLIELTDENTELANQLRVYKSKIEEKEKILGLLLNKADKRQKRQPSPKTGYFNEHKGDEDIVEKLKPFKEHYPDVPIPRALVKYFTDKKYELENKK